MAKEIELSLEETNKLRAQIGLPLIEEEKPKHILQKSGNLEQNEGLSVEETNKLRLSLGLKPIETENSGQKLVERLEKSEKLGKSVGILEREKLETSQFAPKTPIFYNEVETESWLENVGKNSLNGVKLEVSRQEEIHDSGVSVRVAHSTEELSLLKEGEVFVLEDNGVLEENGDVLANEKLTKDAKLRGDIREKRKQESLQFGKYDDESESESVHAVMEGSTIILSEPKKEKTPPKGNTVHISGLFDDLEEEKKPVKMKRMKKKISKKRQRVETEIDDSVPMVTTSLDVDDFVEDDLESMLAVTRKEKQRQRKMMTAEEIASEVQLHRLLDVQKEIGGFVYDDTTDFLESLSARYPATNELGRSTDMVELEEIKAEILEPGVKSEVKSEVKEEVTGEIKVEDTGEVEVPGEISVEAPEPPWTSQTPQFDNLLSTLKYLRANNLVAQSNQPSQRNAYKEADLMKLKISIEERVVREELEQDSSYMSLPQEEKVQAFDRILNEKLVAKGIVAALPQHGKYSRYKQPDRLASYNPEVSLTYRDDQGNELDRKQAWKQLSHQFHGVGPSKKKVKKVKKVKKSENERVIG